MVHMAAGNNDSDEPNNCNVNSATNGKAQTTTTTPVVDYFRAATVKTDEIVHSLIRSGGCIVRNLIDPSDLIAIEKDVRPFLDADKPWIGSFFPPETRRTGGLACKSPTFLRVIVQNRLYQSVCAELVTSKIKNCYGAETVENVSLPQLNSAFAISIGPGAKPQGLHRDDVTYHNLLPGITAGEYRVGRDTSVLLFVAGSKVTRENGTTRFVPGSHLKGSGEAPDEADAVYAEMEPGDGFIMLASTYHGGSANMTTDQERLMYGTSMVKGFLRQVSRHKNMNETLQGCRSLSAKFLLMQEENQYLALPLEKVKQLPKEIQRLLGYGVSNPWTGWVDFKDPVDYILSDEGDDKKDIW